MLVAYAMQPMNIYPCVSESDQPYTDQALTRLACGVLAQAVRDANGSDPYRRDYARDFLVGPDCEAWADLAGIDPAALRAWVLAGCPQPTAKQESRVKPPDFFLTGQEMRRLGAGRVAKRREKAG